MAAPWTDCPTFAIDLSAPAAERLRSFPESLANAAAALSAAMQPDRALIPQGIARVASARLFGRYDAEARAWGRALNEPWTDIILANCAYDFVANLFACSGVLLESPGGPVLARNMDWWPERELARASCCLRFDHRGTPRFWIAGWPGSIGVVSGMSANGFAVALNAVLSNDRPKPIGYPTLLWLRRVVEHARDFDHALSMLSDKSLLAPCLIAVAGRDNAQRVIIERTPNRHALRWGKPGRALVVTNDYRALDDTRESNPDHALAATACGRFDALTEYFRGTGDAEVTDDALLFALTDPDVMMGITAQQMLFRPAGGELRLTVPSRLLAPDATNSAGPDDIFCG